MFSNIILIGFMGSGKSAVGEKLSEIMEMEYMDLDTRIQEKMNMSVQEIFKERGESYFRAEELRLLNEIEDMHNLVISTGGGIVLQKECMDILANNGMIFYLKCSFESILQRLHHETTRPLYNHQNLEEFRSLYLSRLRLYENYAHHTINSDNKEIKNICAEIEQIIRKM